VSTFDCSDVDQRDAGLKAAEAAARAGNLVALPTDTVYGIGADAFNASAVSALLAAKGRGRDMPLPVLVGSWATIDGLALEVSDAARRLIEAFWPGALSLVIRQAPSLAWDLGDTNGTVMVRMPMHPVALDLLRNVGPMAVSSANRSGRPPATTAEAAKDQLGADVSVYLDGGAAPVGVPSTIVDISAPVPRVLREGAVPLDRLRTVIDLPAA
jgi:tRNA threonylcarbamoyl adenosine modification protein (Sua5/YciO/YrdC/YwlC family)